MYLYCIFLFKNWDDHNVYCSTWTIAILNIRSLTTLIARQRECHSSIFEDHDYTKEALALHKLPSKVPIPSILYIVGTLCTQNRFMCG